MLLQNYISPDETKKLKYKFRGYREEDDYLEVDPEFTSEKDKKILVFYDHFKGHMNQLSHYFRHLYQLFKIIDETPERIIENDEKRKYARIVRAQLSNYEQLLIYYNSLSNFGKAWNENNYIKKYKVIKNIPIPISFGYRPDEKFSAEILEERQKGNEFFEWIR